jgi:hypothetical protein
VAQERVVDEEWARRGASFGAVAEAYAEHRPDYPEAAVRWCLAPAGRDAAALRVLDLGAGTGKLTVAGLQDAAGGVAAPSLSRRRLEAAGFGVDQFGLTLFGPAERAEFANSQRRTARSLLAGVATHSKLLVMPPAERDRVLARIRDYLTTRPETADGEFTLPMVTVAVRSARRSL